MSETATNSRRWRDSKLLAFVVGALVGALTLHAVIQVLRVVGYLTFPLHESEIGTTPIGLVLFVGALLGGCAGVMMPRQRQRLVLLVSMGFALGYFLSGVVLIGIMKATSTGYVGVYAMASTVLSFAALGACVGAWWARTARRDAADETE